MHEHPGLRFHCYLYRRIQVLAKDLQSNAAASFDSCGIRLHPNDSDNLLRLGEPVSYSGCTPGKWQRLGLQPIGQKQTRLRISSFLVPSGGAHLPPRLLSDYENQQRFHQLHFDASQAGRCIRTVPLVLKV